MEIELHAVSQVGHVAHLQELEVIVGRRGERMVLAVPAAWVHHRHARWRSVCVVVSSSNLCRIRVPAAARRCVVVVDVVELPVGTCLFTLGAPIRFRGVAEVEAKFDQSEGQSQKRWARAAVEMDVKWQLGQTGCWSQAEQVERRRVLLLAEV